MPGWAVGGLCEYTTGVECSSLVRRLWGSRVDHPCTERSVHGTLCTILAEYSGRRIGLSCPYVLSHREGIVVRNVGN